MFHPKLFLYLVTTSAKMEPAGLWLSERYKHTGAPTQEFNLFRASLHIYLKKKKLKSNLDFHKISKKKKIKADMLAVRVRHHRACRLLPDSAGKSSGSSAWFLHVGQVLCSFSQDLIHWTQTELHIKNHRPEHVFSCFKWLKLGVLQSFLNKLRPILLYQKNTAAAGFVSRWQKH